MHTGRVEVHEKAVGRRQLLRWTARVLLGLGLAAPTLGGPETLRRAGAQATDAAPDTAYRATGIYERSGPSREVLMALVLVPVDENPRPSIWVDRTLEWRDLGSGPLKAFQNQGAGMEQKCTCDAGRVRAMSTRSKPRTAVSSRRDAISSVRASCTLKTSGLDAPGGCGLVRAIDWPLGFR
jgi:hypothetical protein